MGDNFFACPIQRSAHQRRWRRGLLWPHRPRPCPSRHCDRAAVDVGLRRHDHAAGMIVLLPGSFYPPPEISRLAIRTFSQFTPRRRLSSCIRKTTRGSSRWARPTAGDLRQVALGKQRPYELNYCDWLMVLYTERSVFSPSALAVVRSGLLQSTLLLATMSPAWSNLALLSCLA